ncbi:MAG: Fic family protein [Fibrobacteres bacterium]|nr:Fic family protein [Fibrobacterota bacterium]
MYIHELPEWPDFARQDDRLIVPLARVRQLHGRLLGKLDALGFAPLEETSLENLTQDVIRSTEIEGERLDALQVRSSVARRLGVAIPESVAASREVEGMVDLTMDAILHCHKPLSRKRLMDWQGALFPEGRSGLYRIRTGKWRDDSKGPMQVVSGGWGRERVHFQAPEADRIPAEMRRFLSWMEAESDDDPILKAAIAHLWFLTIHPFDDGNGRLARALTDLLLAQMDGKGVRFYSLSAAIMAERNEYYKVLEFTQAGSLDITDWLLWFLGCLERAMERATRVIDNVLHKHLFWQRHANASFNDRHRKVLGLLLEGFEGNLTSGKWAKIARCSTDTALRDIQFLTDQGILVRGDAGGRSTGYRLA